ncbi:MULTISPECIES: FABP family protein [unclassified Microbacterium]|uniref:FABP family protein n=1 Tax=unclassified Microbacterium TaxID=2609290 RepID=UPI001AC8CB49|nr:FABP family protein [Microbacterium sp.]MBN9157424.1 FABP family protein [Microbacterium sp.]MBS1897135.1 FABP family protein [Actinomycetota bacterium]MBS1901998.1 FABP family protein [Actinomycetota bacterium]
MLDLPSDLPADIVPLSWLLGVWEGTGVIDYDVPDPDGGEDHRFRGEFAHRVSFSHDGGPFLNYAATATFTPEEGESVALVAESGYWRLARPADAQDAGPALLPPRESRSAARTVDDVEALRLPEGGFAIEVSIAHSDGTLELYLGRIDGPRIDIATDAIVRAEGAKEYGAASRMYGLVDGHLLWAWDIAALGAGLGSHASARLAKV